MIKEKKKGKYTRTEKSLQEEISGYLRTAGITFIAAAIITVLLSFHARSEMVRNIYASKTHARTKLEAKLAQKIIAQSDLTKSLHNKSFKICMQVGNLYESAEDYYKAEYAYYLAYNKAPENNYNAHYRLARLLITMQKFDDAQKIIDSVVDTNNVKIVNFKTRIYINMGDKYMAENKFVKAAAAYEKAKYYYEKLSKRDKYVHNSIKKRLSEAYLNTADVMVTNGYNSDAIKYLKQARTYAPDNDMIKYKMAIVYADLDPIVSVDYFNSLLEKMPQHIDYDVFIRALMKASNIAEIQGDTVKSKYYRYRAHSVDLFVNNKVVYKNELDVELKNFNIKKVFFRYKLNAKFTLINNSSNDINRLHAEFILRQKNDNKEVYTVQCATRKNPIYSNGGSSNDINVSFGKNIFTKKELEQYYIDVYVYKDKQYKTFEGTFNVPVK